MYLDSYQKDLCSGCEACINICPKQCIKMERDEEGFLYPTIDLTFCIKCNLCREICPIKKDNKFNIESRIFAVYHKNKKIHMESSSGGAFTAFAEKIIKKEGIVYASCFDELNLVKLKRIEKIKDLSYARKSKYVQSEMGKVHIQILNDLNLGKNVLFVGTPCQCDSIKNFLKMKNVNIDKLYLIDIICHGVASPIIWKEYLNYQSICQESDIKSVDFRDKSNGWTPMKMKIIFKNNKIYEKYSNLDGYYRLFFGHYIIRPSCHSCHYTDIKRVSDITIADFWGIKNIAPELFDEYGVSMVLSNTEKGKKMIQLIKEDVVMNEVFCDNLADYQPNLAKPTSKNKNREAFWNLYKKRGFKKAYKKYGVLGTMDKIIDDLKNIVVRIIKK